MPRPWEALKRSRRVVCALTAIILLCCVANLFWIHQDATLRGYDMGPHMLGVANSYAVFADKGFKEGLKWTARLKNASWPGTSYLPMVGLSYIFGLSVEALRTYNLIFLALMVLAVYSIGRRVLSREAGLLAAALVPLYPGVAADSRQIGLDFPCGAMVAVCVALLLATERFSRLGRCALLGVAAGLATLIRPHAHFFLALPVVLVLGLALVRPSVPRWRVLAGAALALLGAMATSAPYWVGNLQQITATFFDHQEGRIIDSVGPSFPFYVQAIQVSAGLFLLCVFVVAALALALCWWRGRKEPDAPRTRQMWVVWAWIIGGAAVLSWIDVHRLRFLVAFLPALAVITGVGLASLRIMPFRRVAAGLVLLGAAVPFLFNTVDLAGLPLPGALPPAVRTIPRTELSLRGGVPIQDPYIQVLQRLVSRLARDHGDGDGVLMRLVVGQRVDPMVLHWAAIPMLMVNLPQLRFTEKRFPEYILDRRPEGDAFNVASVFYPPKPPRVTACYSLRLHRSPAAKRVRGEGCHRTFDEDISHPLGPPEPLRLTVYRYDQCPLSLCAADGPDPKDGK